MGPESRATIIKYFMNPNLIASDFECMTVSIDEKIASDEYFQLFDSIIKFNPQRIEEFSQFLSDDEKSILIGRLFKVYSMNLLDFHNVQNNTLLYYLS